MYKVWGRMTLFYERHICGQNQGNVQLKVGINELTSEIDTKEVEAKKRMKETKIKKNKKLHSHLKLMHR